MIRSTASDGPTPAVQSRSEVPQLGLGEKPQDRPAVVGAERLPGVVATLLVTTDLTDHGPGPGPGVEVRDPRAAAGAVLVVVAVELDLRRLELQASRRALDRLVHGVGVADRRDR